MVLQNPPIIYTHPVLCEKIRTMETVKFSSRCVHGALSLSLSHGALTVRSRYAHSTLTVRSRCAHRTLTVRSRYFHCTLTLSSWRVHGRLTRSSGYSHVKVTVPSRYAHGTHTICSWSDKTFFAGIKTHLIMTVPCL